MSFGDKICRLRGDRSYAAIGAAAGCSGEHIRRLEHDHARPNVSLALRLAREFDVSLDWLADDSQGWPPPQSEAQRTFDIVKQALTIGGLLGEVSADEREILADYRRLDDEAKARVMGFITGLAAGGEK